MTRLSEILTLKFVWALQGLRSQDKLDTFNHPTYSPSMEELSELIHENGCFEIARLEKQPRLSTSYSTTGELRAGMGSLLTKKIEAQPRRVLTAGVDDLASTLFAVLKRKH